MTTITLSKPIKVHGTDITELDLQDPNFDQIQRFGLPVSMDSTGNFTVNVAVAAKYIPVLAQIPPSSLKEAAPFDINNLCWAIWRFFMIPPTMEATEPTE